MVDSEDEVPGPAGKRHPVKNLFCYTNIFLQHSDSRHQLGCVGILSIFVLHSGKLT